MSFDLLLRSRLASTDAQVLAFTLCRCGQGAWSHQPPVSPLVGAMIISA
jgi:hypothetical protein